MSASVSAAAAGGRDLRDPETWGGNKVVAGRLEKFLDEKDGKGELNLFLGGLLEIPLELGQLKGLTVLDVSSNSMLEDLPDIFDQLAALEVLKCQYTNITTLPESLVHCKKLRVLWCYNSKVSALPSWIGEFVALEVLFCNNTSITTLPESISDCTELSCLRCNDTPLESLPANLWRCSKLRFLCLKDCKSLVFPPPEIVRRLGSDRASDDLQPFNNVAPVIEWLRAHDGARPIKAARA